MSPGPFRSFDVVGIGENSVDLVYRLPTSPAAQGPNAKMRISSHAIYCGGQVATTLCTCASLGLRAAYVGVTGSDERGRRIRAALAARGVNIKRAPVRDVPNRYAVILVDEAHGDRIVLWDRSPALALRPDELPPEILASARVVHVDDTDEDAALRAAAIARPAGVPVTSDIDRLTPRTEELFAAVTVAIVAEHVPEALTGERDLERAMRKLRRVQPGPICVTRGARGAMLLEGDRLYESPALAVQAADTTGAGDVFRGAFIVAMLRGDAPAEILRYANAAAAVSCTRHGAIDGVPSPADVAARLAASAHT